MSSTILFIPRCGNCCRRRTERLVVFRCITLRLNQRQRRQKLVHRESRGRNNVESTTTKKPGVHFLLTHCWSVGRSAARCWNSKQRRLLFTGKVRTLRGLIVTVLEAVERQRQWERKKVYKQLGCWTVILANNAKT